MSAADTEPPLFSAYWYKVARVTPRLRPGVRVARRVEGGEVWHVLSVPESNRHFRLDPASWAIVGALDGRATLDAIWRMVLDRFGDATPGQDETIRLLGQLHQADALNAGTAPSLAEFGRRARRQARQRLVQKLKSPLFIKVPLFDPQPLIDATYPLVRPLFSRAGLVLWLMAMLWLAVQAVTHWDALSGAALDGALAAENLVLAAMVFPFAKALHELGHGWAVRHWGGEVREFGIMFLVFLPAPYVDASAAIAFPSRGARIVTGAAGMMVEALLAAGAMWIWLGAEAGLVKGLAFNMLLIAGVSSFLFNGNPLLRFDAYYMLSDAIGVQNLAQRSQNWWSWLVHRHGFGLTGYDSPARTPAEARWFALYHPLSFAYRVMLTLSIALVVAQEYRAIGLALAVWSVTSTLVLPVVQGAWHLTTAPRVAPKRRRALAVSALLVGLPLAALALVPLPHGTVAPGVVLFPDDARLAAPVEAVVDRILVPGGQRVTRGQGILTLTAPQARSELDLILARLDTARARQSVFEAEARHDEAAVARAEIAYLQDARDKARADLAALDVVAARPGLFLAREARLAPGQRLSEGGELGYLVPPDARARIQVAVPATRIDLVETAPPEVRVLIPGRGLEPVPGQILTLAPQATRVLDHPALAQAAGGPLVMDPSDETGQRTALPFHVAVVQTDVALDTLAVGAVVWVRFDHGQQPLLPRIWRAVRQTFLQRLAL